MKSLAANLFVTLVCALALAPAKSQALTGGKFSTDKKFAAIVKIRSAYGVDYNRENCSGVFITPKFMLTAAHCILSKEIKGGMEPISITWAPFPSMDLFFQGIERKLPQMKFHIHPEYYKNQKATNPHDIALVEFHENQSASVIPLSTQPVQTETPVIVTGYGCDKQTKDWATNFKSANAVVDSSKDFINLKKGESQFCQGDSGSPALVETPKGLRVIGVNGYMNLFKSALGGSRDRVVKVDPVLPWILRTIEN